MKLKISVNYENKSKKEIHYNDIISFTEASRANYFFNKNYNIVR